MINYSEPKYQNLETIMNEKMNSLTNKLFDDFNDIKRFVNEHILDTEEVTPHQRLLNKSIKSLRLDSRSYNCLKKKKINTIQKIINYSESDLLNIPHLGKKCIEDIKNSLKEIGLSLK